MTCACVESAEGWRRNYDCSIHVNCDEGCQALENPVTIEEYKAALEHWQSHSYLSGCSHGC